MKLLFKHNLFFTLATLFLVFGMLAIAKEQTIPGDTRSVDFLFNHYLRTTKSTPLFEGSTFPKFSFVDQGGKKVSLNGKRFMLFVGPTLPNVPWPFRDLDMLLYEHGILGIYAKTDKNSTNTTIPPLKLKSTLFAFDATRDSFGFISSGAMAETIGWETAPVILLADEKGMIRYASGGYFREKLVSQITNIAKPYNKTPGPIVRVGQDLSKQGWTTPRLNKIFVESKKAALTILISSSTGCEPCSEIKPLIKFLASKFKKSGVSFVTVENQSPKDLEILDELQSRLGSDLTPSFWILKKGILTGSVSFFSQTPSNPSADFGNYQIMHDTLTRVIEHALKQQN